MGPTSMLKHGKPSYTLMRENADAFVKLSNQPPKVDASLGFVLLQKSQETSYTNKWYTEKEKTSLNGLKNVKKHLSNSNTGITHADNKW